MNKQTDAWLDAHQDQLVTALQRSIRFPSVSRGEESAPGAPFGKTIRAALADMLALCEGFGMTVCDMDGYIGYADAGAGEEMLGILTHLDVVPAGGGWTYPAFGGEVHDGILYGRGTLDDKGPAIASVFALAAVMASGAPFRRRVRLLFGCDEETGMHCLHHYLSSPSAEIPTMSFSPDGGYPVVNSEKGILHVRYEKRYASALTFEAGTVVNAVPGKATATVPLTEAEVQTALGAFLARPALDGETFSEAFRFACAPEGARTRIEVTGVSAHASTPELGKNALQALVALLSVLPLPEMDAETARSLHAALGMDRNGEIMGLDFTDASGRLTLNPGLLSWNGQGLTLSLDIRYPLSMTGAQVAAAIDAAFPGFARTQFEDSPGHMVPVESELVQKLTEVYAHRSGTWLAPRQIGGGTYARHLPNAVAFGPEVPGEESRVHMADECIALSALLYNAKMYADAIVALAL